MRPNTPISVSVLAPFRTHLFLRPGRLNRVTGSYVAFWRRARRELAKSDAGDAPYQLLEAHEGGPDYRPHWSLASGQRVMRYLDISADSLRYTAELVRLRPRIGRELVEDAHAAARAESESAGRVEGEGPLPAFLHPNTRLALDGDSAPTVAFFDNGIALFEARFVVEELPARSRGSMEAFADALRDEVALVTEQLVRRLYRESLFAFIEDLASLAGAADVLAPHRDPWRPAEGEGVFERFVHPLPRAASPATEVLWVARALVPAEGTAERGDALRELEHCWLRDSYADDASGRSQRERDLEEGLSLRWLNYYLGSDPLGGVEHPEAERAARARLVWQAMRLAQYYYAAVETLSDELGDILESAHRRATPPASVLSRRLESATTRLSLALFSYRELERYLSRRKRALMREILETWNFDNLERTALDKAAAARDLTARLDRDEIALASRVLNVVVVLITVLAVADIAIAVLTLGREVATGGTYRLAEESFLIGLLANVSMNWVAGLMIGAALFVIALGMLVGWRWLRFSLARLAGGLRALFAESRSSSRG